jgi:arsenate reductase-like glutaredoxin family protein
MKVVQKKTKTDIRVFGSDTCDDCKKVLKYLETINWDYEYINAFDKDLHTQKICDMHNVDELPHIQFRDNKGNVTKEFIGLKAFSKNMKETLEYITKKLELDENETK